MGAGEAHDGQDQKEAAHASKAAHFFSEDCSIQEGSELKPSRSIHSAGTFFGAWGL